MQKQNSSSGILAVLFIGVLMGALDISIVGPAIPSIEHTISMDKKALAWIFSVYVLFNLSGQSARRTEYNVEKPKCVARQKIGKQSSY
jgi:MFS family permease